MPKIEAINKETEEQEEASAKKNSEHNVPQNSVTPGPTAMKGLFAEENKVVYYKIYFSISFNLGEG